MVENRDEKVVEEREESDGEKSMVGDSGDDGGEKEATEDRRGGPGGGRGHRGGYRMYRHKKSKSHTPSILFLFIPSKHFYFPFLQYTEKTCFLF